MADIEGTSGNDTLRGTRGDDNIYGRGGNDRLLGGEGSDYVSGGAGNDFLSGGPGDLTTSDVDTLIGGDGNDTLFGGIGTGTVFVITLGADNNDVVSRWLAADYGHRIDLTAFGDTAPTFEQLRAATREVSPVRPRDPGLPGDVLVDLTAFGGGTIRFGSFAYGGGRH